MNKLYLLGSKKWHTALCISLTAVLLGGCWDNRELNEIGISSGTAFDWIDNRWTITYQVINPLSSSGTMGSGGESNTPPFLTFTEQGTSIMEAISRSSMTSTRQLFFAHSRMTVFSENMARKGITEVLDLFLRKPDARETVNVFISRRKGRDILDQLMQSSKNQGAGVQLMMQQEANLSSYYPGIRMFELAVNLASESHCATIPEIKLSGQEVMDTTQETAITDLPSRLELGRLGVLKKDKLVGWLSIREAFGLTFLTDQIKTASISIASEPNKENVKDSSFSLLHSKTKVKPKWENDHFVMDVHIRGGGMLLQLSGDVDLNKPGEINRLEQNINKQVLSYIQDSWNALQKINADATGFATLVHRKYPRRWKQIKASGSWDKEFRAIEIRPHVSIKIERFGLGSKSYKNIEKE
ncbi:Ger(x)C family spore germination protein [Paenibacillus physcomitrellae]|uniref:Germination protein n=1 Tax=Paenibacillus physcomitrellae TaxID=1619311 RepID=A0ABQ1GM86_9BACL|nr:Ger(x)C family spore germination protein [Paenibacillus physcomitrellae]GGA46393.1 germination protein [Paenibacillus physcomitrellae]